MREHSNAFYLWQLIKTVRNWPVYLMNRFGISRPNSVTYHLRNGIDVTTRSYAIDRGGINEVWLDRIYDPPGFDWSACKTIIDVGANIGTFTLFAASKAPHATIHTFEPDPDTAAVVRKNIEQNHLQNRVTVHQLGVAATPGERTFHITPRCSWFGSLYAPPGESKPVTVQVTSLPTLFERQKIERCDFLKMDCEGAEYEILYQMPDDILKRIKFIALEHHPFVKEPGCSAPELKAFLEKNGFAVKERANSIFYATNVSS